MRLRIAAFVVIAVLTYCSVEHKNPLPSLPDPTALIASLRNQISPFHFNLQTDPEAPACGEPITLKVQVVDSDGQPADGLKVEADVFMTGSEKSSRHVVLYRKKNGSYEGRLEVETAGSWNVDFTAEKGSKRGRQRVALEVGPAQGNSDARDDNDS